MDALPEAENALVMVLGPEEIRAVLKHYGKFIWVDRAEVYEKTATGYLSITAERCQGHFNTDLGYPLILPEIFFAEFAGQTGAVHAMLTAPKRYGEKLLPVFAGEKRVRTSASAFVGDVLTVKLWYLQQKPPLVRAECSKNGREEVIFWMEFGYRFLPERFWKKLVAPQR